jgi:hypothetical protein
MKEKFHCHMKPLKFAVSYVLIFSFWFDFGTSILYWINNKGDTGIWISVGENV